MFDIVAPIQSYYESVARGLDNLISEASIERLLGLEQTFETTGPSNTYSPWDVIDHFGRDRIRDAIHTKAPVRHKVTIATGVSSDQPESSRSTKSSSPKKSVKF